MIASFLQSRFGLWLTYQCARLWARFQTSRADLADIYFCYRLLLERQSEYAGWQQWVRQVAVGMTRGQLVTAIMGSPEFHHNRTVRAATRVDCGEFVLNVDASDPSTGKEILDHKTHEPHVTEVVKRLLKPDDVVLDIGCNIGWYTLTAAAIVRQGKVIGLEPNHQNVQLVYQSLQDNHFENVTIYPYAATDQRVLLRLGGFAAYGSVHAVDHSEGEYVQGVPIDELLSQEARLDLVKMDIEGHEPVALQGMRRTLAAHRPIIVSEFHPKLIKEFTRQEPQGYLEALVGLGYQLQIIELEGQVTEAMAPATIMEYWQQLNLRLGTGDNMHLDILAKPL